MEKLIEIVNGSNRGDNLLFIVFDTTLTSYNFDIDAFYDKIKEKSQVILVETRSCLKLDQQGFEFTNVGLLNLKMSEQIKQIGQKIANLLRKARTVMGTALSFFSASLLDFSELFIAQNKKYQESIYNNTKEFANSISSGGIIKKVCHPSLDKRKDLSWAVSPILFIHLSSNERRNYLAVLEALRKNLEKRNLELDIGNSFGFRQSRVEVITTLESSPFNILKVAPGKIKGLTYYSIIEALNELNDLNNIDQLRKYYSI